MSMACFICRKLCNTFENDDKITKIAISRALYKIKFALSTSESVSDAYLQNNQLKCSDLCR